MSINVKGTKLNASDFFSRVNMYLLGKTCSMHACLCHQSGSSFLLYMGGDGLMEHF